MAKHHHAPPTAAAAAAPPPSSSSSQQQQLILQLRQDFAKLMDKDPDTRRSAMEALKGFIEGELDVRTMACFLEQVSGESSRGESASRTFAISLFVDVARVHKQMTLPFIPRIMGTVVRSLSSGAGVQNFHQACAKVVSSVARYALESSPASPALSPVECEVVFRDICHPLVGVLCSKVEPVAVGSATCLQALVESEKWKLSGQATVKDLCYKASVALGDKGTKTVAHIHLVRSLARFNSGVLQEFGEQLLKSGADILTASGGSSSAGAGTPVQGGRGGQGSWQQRAAAAQLLSTLLCYLDQRVLGSGLLHTLEALEHARLDKITVVRQAVGEALTSAKALASQIDPLLLQRDVHNDTTASSSPSRGKIPSARKRGGQRKSLWRTEEFSASTMFKDDSALLPVSQESQLISYASSPSSSISFTPTLDVPASPYNASSAPRNGRSPLYPAKQSGALPLSSSDRYTSESELGFILAHLKSSESKENAPLMGKPADSPFCTGFDDMSCSLKCGNGKGRVVQMACIDDDLSLDDLDRYSVISDTTFPQDSRTSDISGVESGMELLSEDNRSEAFQEGPTMLYGEAHHAGQVPEDECPSNTQSTLINGVQDHDDDAASSTCYNSIAHVVNLEEVVSPQVPKNHMTAEDFLLFATPRRLVRSLQSVSSTPDSRGTSKSDADGLGMDSETLSESGWSVRDNPIAGDSDEDSPKKGSIFGNLGKDGLRSRSWDINGLKTPASACSVVPLRTLDGEISVASSTDLSSLVLGPSAGCRQLFDCGVDDEKLELGGKFDESCECQHAGIVSIQGCAAAPMRAVQVAEEDVLREKLCFRWLVKRGIRQWNSSSRVRSKLHSYTEVFLGGALCAVLIVLVAIAILNCLNGQPELHVLVPT